MTLTPVATASASDAALVHQPSSQQQCSSQELLPHPSTSQLAAANQSASLQQTPLLSMSSVESQQPPQDAPEMQSCDPSSDQFADISPELLQPALARRGVSSELLFGRWRLTLELFGRVFIEDVGAEPGSVIVQLGGFPVKEARFRRDMEKLRNNQQRDLSLAKVCKYYFSPGLFESGNIDMFLLLLYRPTNSCYYFIVLVQLGLLGPWLGQ